MARRLMGFLGLAAALAVAAPSLLAWAQTGQSLGSVRLPRAVMANGQSLAAGSYTVRLSTEAVSAVVGQAPERSRWVEFTQGGQVRGRELATVLAADALREIAEGGAPAPGSSKVERLKGDDYLRVWINSGGTHYLIHLATGATR